MKAIDSLRYVMDNRTEIINLDNCKEIYTNCSGTSATRYKVWLEYNNEYIIFKEANKHVGGERIYEDVSEMIVNDIGEIIGVDVIFTKLATYKNMIGTFTYKINNLIELSSLISIDYPEFNKKKPFDVIKYDIEFVKSYFKNIEQFYDLMILDYIVSQSDRHPSNIGFVNNYLAPIYDNGNSLGSFIYDDELDRYINKVNKLCSADLKSCVGLGDYRPSYWNNIIDTIGKEDYVKKKIHNDLLPHRKEILSTSDKYDIIDKRKELIKAILNYKLNYMEAMYEKVS